MANENVTVIKDTTANPAPLGLFGFGMTTILLNIHNAGVYPMDAMILAMGIFYGGLAQVVAGIMEWKKNNTFGTVAFTSYGFFWLSLVGLIVMPKLNILGASLATPTATAVAAPNNVSMTAYLAMWGVFTFLLFLGTLKKDMATKVVFGSLTILFALLALGDITENPTIKMIAGIEGILCGASAIYAGIAQVLNEIYGKVVLPIGAPKK